MLKQTEGLEVLLAEREAPAGDTTIRRRKQEVQSKLDALFKERDELEKQIVELRKQIE